MANEVTLQSEERKHPVDENLRPIKIGGKTTALELAQQGNGARVNGDLEVTGDIKGNVKDIELDLTKINSTDLTIDDSGDITLDAAGGDVNILQADLNIPATKGLYLDGGTDTYIYESGDDLVRYVVGGDIVMILTEAGNSGNIVNFGDSAAGFTSYGHTYGATNTQIYFSRFGLKGEIVFDGGNITNLIFHFPNVSCNCILRIKQDGTGSRTITNYKTFDQELGNEGTLFFPDGGTSPTLSTGANATDILSIYWDNGRHEAFGVMSTNFVAS